MISTDIHSLNAVARGKLNTELGKTLMTTNPYPIYYRMITKCGCTYIMNILYHLHYGYTNLDPFAVHDKGHIIPKADGISNADIIDSPYSFVVIRDPITRFMSLYFDKLYGGPRKNESFSLGQYFIDTGLVIPNIGDDIGGHRENCIRAITWIRQNLHDQTDQPVNWHWKPQKFRLNQVHMLQMNVLLLEDIGFQLTKILEPLVPHIDQVMQTVSAQNISKKPVQITDVLNVELSDLITNTYQDDTQIHQEVSAYWRGIKEDANE